MDYVNNIIGTYLRATDDEVTEGMEWYPNAHIMARTLASSVWVGAGVIAAYSINTDWERNVILAASTLLNNEPAPGLGMSVDKARRILAGEDVLSVLNGHKVRAFASAIADPTGSKIATIDRHARDIAMGRVMGPKVKIPKTQFYTLSDAYVEAAELADIGVAQLQAVTWLAWRRMKGIK